jgi:hypothetical protein
MNSLPNPAFAIVSRCRQTSAAGAAMPFNSVGSTKRPNQTLGHLRVHLLRDIRSELFHLLRDHTRSLKHAVLAAAIAVVILKTIQ